MSTIAEIESAVSRLSPEELTQFRAWYLEFDADAWDSQIAQDAAAGKLDNFVKTAMKEIEAGNFTDL